MRVSRVDWLIVALLGGILRRWWDGGLALWVGGFA
jgi:hypothetical protein